MASSFLRIILGFWVPVNGLKGVIEAGDITISETQDGKWSEKIFVLSTVLEAHKMENNNFFLIKATVILTHEIRSGV